MHFLMMVNPILSNCAPTKKKMKGIEQFQSIITIMSFTENKAGVNHKASTFEAML